ncbi:MAG: GNAT family N-acetyltransferase [Candidatus Pelagibacter sp. TMED118]|nr:MAG: GNAT family N-acetyltransferase [Candidatus Pelagibacter sp. TMED118]|tara:strand:- start:521 stop:1027 length:507 start_codon:yes stop_codon:yes gene_type:complete
MREIFRYYLEIKNINDLHEVNIKSQNQIIKLVDPIDFNLNKFFYKQIGKEHRWLDRLSWNDQSWINYLKNESVQTYVQMENNNLVGFFEIIFDNGSKDTEIAYFGILREFREKGYGGNLLSYAIKLGFNKGSKKVWVHTCSLDHKNALQNYKSRGMKVFRKEKIKIPA